MAVAWPILLLARDIGELTWNSFVSVILILVQTAAIFTNVAETGPRGNGTFVPAPVLAFGSTPASSWSAVASAVGAYLYSFCPLFIAVEISASMRQPEQIHLAILVSFFFNVTVYVATGLFVVGHWGGGLPSPVTEELVGTPSAIANAILFYCTFLDFAIVGAVLNRELQGVWMPTFDRLCTVRNLPTWLMLTLPSLLLALAIALLTPKLETLAGFLESLCIPLTMLVGVPAMLLLLRGRRESLGIDQAAVKQTTALELARGWEPALVAGVGVGIGLLIVIFSKTLYSIFYETDYGGDYWCEVVA